MAKTLEATLRNRKGSGALHAMRREGFIPCVIYGATENKSIKVHRKTFRDLLESHPSSQILVDLAIEGEKPQLVFIRDIQFNALTGELLHADFLAVTDDTTITARLPLKLLGEPKGVKAGGLLEQLVYTLKVKTTPGNLPLRIETNVTHLGIADNLTIGDIDFEEGVKPVLDDKVLVALVAKTRVAKSTETGAEPGAADADGEGEDGEEGEGGDSEGEGKEDGAE